jgi:L-arabinose isomerase
MSTAVGLEAFEDLARILGVELFVIDENTRARDVENVARWNSAYWRLAPGI